MEEREVTLDNITKDDILAMAKTIEQYGELLKEQQGYIIQLQTQLKQRSQQLHQIMQQNKQGIETFITVDSTLDL